MMYFTATHHFKSDLEEVKEPLIILRKLGEGKKKEGEILLGQGKHSFVMNAQNILIWSDVRWRTLSELSCQGRMYGGEFIWANQPLSQKGINR